MKGYKMVKEAAKHFDLQHPDGSHFRVAKSGLSDAHMEKVRKMADGGLVGDDEEEDLIPTPMSPINLPVEAPPPGPFDPMSVERTGSANFASMPMGQPEPAPQATPQSGAVNPNTVTDVPSGGMQTTSFDGPAPDTSSAINQIAADNEKIVGGQVKALQAGAAAAQTAARDQAKIYEDHARAIQDLEAKTQANHAVLDKEQAQLQQDVANAKLDPHRVWSNASTGNKILAGIGVLLSGIGSGLTGGPNLAMQVINKTIDDDIAAQKNEIGKKENLLSMNLKKYGDLQSATAATSLHLNSVLQGQIAAASSRATGPQAQANAALAMGQLQQQAAALKQQLAVKTLKDQIVNNGGAQGLSPSVAQDIAKERGLGVVNTPAGIKFAKTPDDAKKLTELATMSQSVDKQIGDMMSFASKTGTTAPFSENNALAEGMQTQLMLDLKTIDQLGVLSKGDLDLMNKLVPNPGAIRTDKAIAQLNQLRKIYKDKVQSAYVNHLVNPSGLGPPPTAGQDQSTGLSLTNWKK